MTAVLEQVPEDMTDEQFADLDKQMREADAVAPEPVEEVEEVKPVEAVEPPKVEEKVEPPKKEEQHIPPAALMAEREKRRAAEAEAQEMRRRLEALTRSQEDAEKAPKVPEFSQDPLGNLVERAKMTESQLEQMRKYAAQREVYDQTVRAYQSAANKYGQENPDFTGAYQYMLANRKAELMEWGHSEQDAEQRVEAEEIQFAYEALRNKRNPAEMIYTIAKHRGYAPKQAKAPEPEPEKVLETVEAGQKAVARAGGSAGGHPDIVRRLADPDLSSKEFDELYEQAKAKGLLG